MNSKEHIDTLISVGTGLPPVNPYLDDSSQSDDIPSIAPKSKAGRKPSNPPSPQQTKTNTAPDPKEYIAELERPEDADILF